MADSSTNLQRALAEVKILVTRYLHPPPSTAAQRSMQQLTVRTLNQTSYIGPWNSLSTILGFVRSWLGHLKTLVEGSDILVDGGWVGVTADGLANACARGKHGSALCEFAEEVAGHLCVARAFELLTAQPHLPSACPALRSIEIVWSEGLPWFAERSILQLFGSEHLEHAESLTAQFDHAHTPHSRAQTAFPFANSFAATTTGTAQPDLALTMVSDDDQTTTTPRSPFVVAAIF
jgi:hypothetical protein